MLPGSLASGGCELHFEFPPIPLPPLVAPKPLEAYLPPHPPPPSLSLPPLHFRWFGCGAGMLEPAETVACGLIELFGTAEHFATALAARRVEITQPLPPGGAARRAGQETPSLTLPPADAALLRDWLTSDASYVWGEDFVELPECLDGARITFHHAGKVATLIVHVAHDVVVVSPGEPLFLARLAPPPPQLEPLLARWFR